MDFLKRELIGGLVLIAALATFAGGNFRLTPVVLALFSLGVLWTAAVVFHALLGRRRGGAAFPLADRALSAHLSKELQTGYELRAKARMAYPGTDDLFEACQTFMEWGLAVNEWVIANAPTYYADLSQIAPWAIQGKGEVLALMDARLRSHSDIAKKLGSRE